MLPEGRLSVDSPPRGRVRILVVNRSTRAKALTGLAVAIMAVTVILAVVTRDWGLLIVLVGVAALYTVAFRSRLNGGHVVPTEHAVNGRLDAVEFFWRPG